jgi:dihydrofolate synthase / folylpolyglutamate synthase
MFTNYNDTISFLFNQLPMFSKIGTAAYKKDLSNTIALCNSIDNPQQHFKSIHIAGTNGKGSTSHQLAAILQAAGYTTGLYTSPHLKDFRERIKINGKMISEQSVINFTNTIQPQIDLLQPSFFEITVAMAFYYFAEQKVDIAIIETGLGGRLDSTNIIAPIACLITNIGYDHQNILGDTLQEIATEKAGIIKANTPIIISELQNEISNVFEETAKNKNAPLYYASHHFETKNEADCFQVNDKFTNETLDINTALKGWYQQKNINGVFTLIKILRNLNFNILNNHIIEGLEKTIEFTGLYGRWQILNQSPLTIADVAHNESGINELLVQTKAVLLNKPNSKLHIILGMVKDKEVEKVLKLLPTYATYYFTAAQIPRALLANDLKDKGLKYDLIGNTYENVNKALLTATQQAMPNDVIIICGSIFLIGELDNLIPQ